MHHVVARISDHGLVEFPRVSASAAVNARQAARSEADTIAGATGRLAAHAALRHVQCGGLVRILMKLPTLLTSIICLTASSLFSSD